jgi:hypothetical protein
LEARIGDTRQEIFYHRPLAGESGLRVDLRPDLFHNGESGGHRMTNKAKSRISQMSQRGRAVQLNGESEEHGGAAAAAPGPRVEDWAIKNHRRIFLITQKFSHGLSPEEQGELAALQAEADRYLDEVAPLPFDHLQRLEEQIGLPAADPAGSDHGRSDPG